MKTIGREPLRPNVYTHAGPGRAELLKPNALTEIPALAHLPFDLETELLLLSGISAVFVSIFPPPHDSLRYPGTPKFCEVTHGYAVAPDEWLGMDNLLLKFPVNRCTNFLNISEHFWNITLLINPAEVDDFMFTLKYSYKSSM